VHFAVTGDHLPEKGGSLCTGSIYLPLLILAVIPPILISVVFSKIGVGVAVFKEIAAHESVSNTLVGLAILGLFLLYLFDFSYWTGWGQVARRVYMVFCTGLGVIAGMLVLNSYPAVPLGIIAFFIPLFYFKVKKLLFLNVDGATFVLSMGRPLFVAGVANFVWWLVWVGASPDHYFDERRIGAEINCVVTSRFSCLGAYVLWGSPLVVSAILVLCSAMSHTLHSTCPARVCACVLSII
jgi:hypothetical protein